MIRIQAREPVGPSADHRIDRHVIRVGRAEGNDLVLRDPAVSRVHAELRLEKGRWLVEDLGSSNGTLLNRRRIAGPKRLKPGDEIAMGGSVLVFEPPAERTGPETEGRPTEPIAVVGAVPGFRRGDLVLIGTSEPARDLVTTIQRVAPSEATILIRGESGTGKELVARLIHECSARAGGPFVVINCPALPGTLLEAELFGVEKGVATGVEPRPGHFETARGGTVLLDEIGDLDPGGQAKILRVLEEKSVERVGGRVPIPLDVRILAATHHDISADMERGAFRRDLYHRLNTVTVRVPSLRDRLDDIPLLVEHFLRRSGDTSVRFGEEAMDLLLRYDFPGNVRELERIVTRARLMGKGPCILPEDLPEEVREHRGGQWGERTLLHEAADVLYQRVVSKGESFWEVVQKPYLAREVSRDAVRRLIARAYERGDRSYKKAARLLGVEDEYRKFMNFIHHHGLKAEE